MKVFKMKNVDDILLLEKISSNGMRRRLKKISELEKEKISKKTSPPKESPLTTDQTINQESSLFIFILNRL
jgi:hypothetical protein